MEKPLDESFMEIVTHVLTNEQHLDDTRKETVRSNIDAAKKASNTTEGNLAGFDSNGELVDSGIGKDTVIQGVYRQIEGQAPEELPIDENGKVTVEIPAGVDVSGKADKVSDAVGGNFAGLDNEGNLADSGYNESDFATSAQGEKADTAYQKPGNGIPKSDLASDVQDSLGKADTALQEHQDISGKADKVTGANSEDFAGLDANGNLVDSGKKASDFASASAVQSVKMKDDLGGELNNGTKVIIPEASTTSLGVMSADDKRKLNGIEVGANKYIHPSHDQYALGMYKVTVDTEGHVCSAVAIQKEDITVLGIPAQDTTYQFADGYDEASNIGATVATVQNAVSNAIDALDVTVASPDTPDAHFVIQLVEENGLLTGITVLTDNTVTASQVNTAIAEALANYGGFQVVDLTTGDNPHPDVTNPSEKYIYLTKDSQSSARDPYTEWIYIKGDESADPPTQSHWEVIGETSVDLSNYIQKLSNATTGNLVKVKADGSIEDAGAKVSDFATAAQGAKAESSVQSVTVNNGTEITPDGNGKVNLPLASTTDPGAMSASDKSKLDGINNYIESATVAGRTMTLTPKSGPAVTFNDTGDINVIEKISVNGIQQTVTNKGVDITIPAAAHNAKITLKVGGAATGDTTPVAGDFTVDQTDNKDITIPVAVSASGNDPAKPGVMSSDDKTKLDGIPEIPSTGTPGQVLTKTQNGVTWSDPESATLPVATESDSVLYTAEPNGEASWVQMEKTVYGSIMTDEEGTPILDEEGKTIQDEDAVTLWTGFNGKGFGADRAVADENGNNIVATYATKADVAEVVSKIGSIADGGTLTDGATINVANNAVSRLTTEQSALALNVNLGLGEIANFAVEITTSVNATLTVTSTIGNTVTTLHPSVAGGTSLESNKIYQVTCVGSCWTVAEFADTSI